MTDLLALGCTYCASTPPKATLTITMQTVGRPYLNYETPETIECDTCEAEWEPNGSPRLTPKWDRWPDLYTKPTGGER